jgi:hypothetical protein
MLTHENDFLLGILASTQSFIYASQVNQAIGLLLNDRNNQYSTYWPQVNIGSYKYH